MSLLRGTARLPFIARIGRVLFYRARPTFPLESGLDGLPLRASHRKAKA